MESTTKIEDLQLMKCNDMDKLINRFCEKYNFSQSDALLLLNQMDLVEFKKHHKIIEEDKRNSNLYILKDGFIRTYSIVEGIETTYGFESEGNVFFSTNSYISNKPSRVTFEALTSISVFCISREKLNELFNSSVAWSNIGRRLIEQNWLLLEKEMFEWDKPTAKERYMVVLEQTPELIKYIPLHKIASYLRITPQSFSRIRAELKR